MSEQQPENPLVARFQTGCHYQQQGELNKALDIYRELLTEVEGSPLILYNVGLAHQELGDHKAATIAYEQALRAAPADIDILYNLGLCYQQTDNRDKALSMYQKAHDHSPGDPDILYNIACCQQQNQLEDKAIQTYEQVLCLDREHPSALGNLAYLYQKEGQEEKAIALYKRLVQLEPDHQAARHMLTSLTGAEATDSPKEYVRDVFDHYSDHYEVSLVGELGYDVPNKLRTLFDSLVNTQHPLTTLDLGCGTGLSGVAFHDLCATLTGVDLSEKMVAIAEKKEIYTRLVVMDLLDFLKESDQSFDLLLAADVLTYLGKLDDIFHWTYQKSCHGAHFCFSTEKTERTGFHLGKTGRFQHGLEYLRNSASTAGWRVLAQQQTNLRREKGNWIVGNLLILVKQ